MDQCISGHYLSILVYVLWRSKLCSISSVRITPVQSTCRYLEHFHVTHIRLSTMSSYPVSHSLVGCMALDAKYTPTIFELQILTKMSEYIFPHDHWKLDRVGKTYIRDDLNLLQMEIPKIIRITIMRIDKVINVLVDPSSSESNSRAGNVKMCWSGVM